MNEVNLILGVHSYFYQKVRAVENVRCGARVELEGLTQKVPPLYRAVSSSSSLSFTAPGSCMLGAVGE